MFQMNVDRDDNLPEEVMRTRRIALMCGLLGCLMMTISILGLMY